MGDLVMEAEQHLFRSKHSSVPVPENLTLPEFVLSGADQYADKVALVEAAAGLGGKIRTYGEVARDTRRFAWALQSLGLRKGHVVVVALPNLAIYPVVALGIMAAGGVFSGVNPLATSAEIRKQVEDSEAKLIVADASTIIFVGEENLAGAITWDELLEASDKAGRTTAMDEEKDQKLQQSDVCALPYSSGTTGSSKGVMLTHRNLIASLCSSLFSVPAEMVGQVTILGLMPFFHIYGITGICCAALRNKARVVVLRRFELRGFLQALIDYEVTFAPIVPPIMLAMVKSPIPDEFDLGGLKLRSVMTAAAPLAPELREAFDKKFPDEEAGEIPAACVVKKAGAKDTEEDIMTFLASNVASYKKIRVLKFLNSIPKSPSGKILRRVLKETFKGTQK